MRKTFHLHGIFCVIFFQIFLICSLFTTAWGQTNIELCVKDYNVKDYTNAFPACKEAAKQGNAEAQFYLGQMYSYGDGVQKDGSAAAIWYRKAAKQGNAEAKSLLTKIFDNDKGKWTSFDDFMLGLLKLTADANDSDSQFELAEKHISGAGVEKNRYLAEKWLIHSILNDPENKKSIELIEKEFNWHCVDGFFCTSIIKSNRIIHDKNLSWYWEIGLVKFELNKEVIRGINKRYDVMNCNNRTLGFKTFQVLDDDLHVVPKKDYTFEDDKIKFKPLEPNTYNDKLFNYVCVDKLILIKRQKMFTEFHLGLVGQLNLVILLLINM